MSTLPRERGDTLDPTRSEPSVFMAELFRNLTPTILLSCAADPKETRVCPVPESVVVFFSTSPFDDVNTISTEPSGCESEIRGFPGATEPTTEPFTDREPFDADSMHAFPVRLTQAFAASRRGTKNWTRHDVPSTTSISVVRTTSFTAPVAETMESEHVPAKQTGERDP